jgi:type I site-specific restriction endonuclease
MKLTPGAMIMKKQNGSLDFLLVDSDNKPICVLEAKKESLHPLVAKNKQENMQRRLVRDM